MLKLTLKVILATLLWIPIVALITWRFMAWYGFFPHWSPFSPFSQPSSLPQQGMPKEKTQKTTAKKKFL